MNFITKLLTRTRPITHVIKISYRNYPRWTSRTPLKVLKDEEEQDPEIKDFKELVKQKSVLSEKQHPHKSIDEATKIKWRYQVDSATPSASEVEIVDRDNTKDAPKKKKPTKQQIKTTDMMETVIDEKGQFLYTKMKNNDSRVGQLLTTIKSNSSMLKKDLILLEGKRLIQDALQAGCTLKYILFTRKTEIEYLKDDLPRYGAKMFKMPYKEMQMWSDLATTPGIMGLFKTPNPENYVSMDSIPLTIYCDNIREPGNLGSILRVAASAGCQKVLLSHGCTNLWDGKVTRSSAGSIFKLRILPKANIEGLREDINDLNGRKMLFIADNKVIAADASKSAGQNQLSALINEIPIIPYYAVNLREANRLGREIVLVIGGETQGIHEDVYMLAKEVGGVRLNIPMSNGVDSLNTGTAMGIITFELYRQFMSKSGLN